MTNPTPATTQVVHLDFIALANTVTESAIEELIQEAAGLNTLASVRVVGVIRAPQSPPQSYDLAFFFVLDAFTDLEPFGTNPLYTRFLQGKVAPLLKGFAGTDVALTAPFPARLAPYGVCLALAAPEQTYDWEVRSALETWATQPGNPQKPASSANRAMSPLSTGGVEDSSHSPSNGGVDQPAHSRSRPPGTEPTPSGVGGDSSPRPGAIDSVAVGLAVGERQRYRGCVLRFTDNSKGPGPFVDRRFEPTVIAGTATRL